MAGKKLTEDEKMKFRIQRDTKAYMQSVVKFLEGQYGEGGVPFELNCSLVMLETYYHQFLTLNYEISKLDSLMIDSRYGAVPHPILKARDGVVGKLDMIMKQLSITFKDQNRLHITEPKVELSPLEKFAQGKIEKR